MKGCTGGHFTKLRDEDAFLSFEECRQQTLQEGAFLVKFRGFPCLEPHRPCSGPHLLGPWTIVRTD